MSTHVDTTKEYVWLDGDAYRCPAGSPRPTDPFITLPQIPTTPTPTDMLPFGGIKVGFEVSTDRDMKKIPVWNKRNGPARVSKGVRERSLKFMAVDNSEATTLTVLQGGSISESPASSGVFEWQEGDSEEFGLLIVVRDGDASEAYWDSRATLQKEPINVKLDDTDLAGYEFDVIGLGEGFKKITSTNPLSA